MYSRYPKMRPLRLVIWRLRHSRLRRDFHLRVVADVGVRGARGWVLDVGSGPGLLALKLAARNPSLRIVCVDVEPGMLKAAREAGCPYAVRATADHLPFRDGQFATVVCTATLKDWARRAEGLHEISRVLPAGGTAFVYDFITTGPGSDPPGFARRFGVTAELLRRRMARMIPFSLDDLRGLAAAACDAEVRAQIDPVPEFGAARLLLSKSGSP